MSNCPVCTETQTVSTSVQVLVHNTSRKIYICDIGHCFEMEGDETVKSWIPAGHWAVMENGTERLLPRSNKS